MPDQKDIAQAKRALEQNEHEGKTAEIEGAHPGHAPQPGKKTPQEHEDKDAIDESGNLLHPPEDVEPDEK